MSWEKKVNRNNYIVDIMLDLVNKDFKIINKNVFKDVREKVNIMKEKMVNINRKIKYIKN